MHSIKSPTSARKYCCQTCGSDLCFVAHASWYGFLHTSNLLCEKVWGEDPTSLSGKGNNFFSPVELRLASETERQFFSTLYTFVM